METAYSLASAALGAAIAALAWLVAHSRQITTLLNALPTALSDVSAARTTVDTHLAAVKAGAETAGQDVEALARLVVSGVEDLLHKRDAAPAATPAVQPEATAQQVTAPAGLAEGGTYTVKDGALVPTGA